MVILSNLESLQSNLEAQTRLEMNGVIVKCIPILGLKSGHNVNFVLEPTRRKAMLLKPDELLGNNKI